MNQSLPEERELLEKVASGDELAFARLVDHYSDSLGDHIQHITRSHATAQEVVQDVFLKIWVSREALMNVRDFRSYLFIASRNQAIEALKKHLRHTQRLTEYEHWVRVGEQKDSPEKIAVEQQYYSLIDRAIEALPSQQKKAFILSRQMGKKYEEIAREMGISKESVKKYLQIATQSVSNHIREHMDTTLIALYLLSEYQLHQMAV